MSMGATTLFVLIGIGTCMRLLLAESVGLGSAVREMATTQLWTGTEGGGNSERNNGGSYHVQPIPEADKYIFCSGDTAFLPMSPSSFSDKNINPQLLNMDPAASILQWICNGTLPPPPIDTSAGDDDMDQDPPPASGILNSTTNHSGNTSSLVSFVQLTHSSDELQVLLLAHVLELLDLSCKNEKAELWTISNSLNALSTHRPQWHIEVSRLQNISWHVYIVIAHPISLPNKAMQECKVDLPSEDKISHNDIILAQIRVKGTHYQNIMKTKVKASTSKKSETHNIAALADKVLKGTKMKPIAQFYQHLAFIFCVVEYPKLTEDEFWPKVDEIIDDYRRSCKTKDKLSQVFNTIYEKDKKMYGDPAVTEYKTYLEIVQPVPKKRKISEVDDDEDDDEGDENESQDDRGAE
ncbi:hypothetical protein B0H10DRAFT_1955496 [Mycena sp. CBHHK59/15]|nr:hypothetical protein B0H10DRAFT_1955496 [Mycena sp. CBHHK59/15]